MSNQIELIEGTNRDTSKSQYFTPPKLAQRVVEWAGVARDNDNKAYPLRVVEPSAGNGALVRPLVAAGAQVCAVEIDERYHQELCAIDGRVGVETGRSFLEMDGGDFWPLVFTNDFDLCVMNPPYHDDGEAKFVCHALEFAPRVVGIFRADVFYTVGRAEGLWGHVRPTRAAFCARRPWKGAETDYVVLELVKRDRFIGDATVRENCVIEWWEDKWS